MLEAVPIVSVFLLDMKLKGRVNRLHFVWVPFLRGLVVVDVLATRRTPARDRISVREFVRNYQFWFFHAVSLYLSFRFAHRVWAALRAISRRLSGLRTSARRLPPFAPPAFPPRLPSSTAAGFFRFATPKN
jgi:hypothetical protein